MVIPGMVILFVAVVMLYGCRKDDNPAIPSEKTDTRYALPQGNAVFDQAILDFFNKYDTYILYKFSTVDLVEMEIPPAFTRNIRELFALSRFNVNRLHTQNLPEMDIQLQESDTCTLRTPDLVGVFNLMRLTKATAGPPLSEALAHRIQTNHAAVEVLNPTTKQERVVEATRPGSDQQMPETIQREARLWALDYFERTHHVILSLFHDESAVNRVIASSPGDVHKQL